MNKLFLIRNSLDKHKRPVRGLIHNTYILYGVLVRLPLDKIIRDEACLHIYNYTNTHRMFDLEIQLFYNE